MLYEESLRRLREEVIRANVLVREANQLSSEMKKDTDFAVTLQVLQISTLLASIFVIISLSPLNKGCRRTHQK